MATSRFVLTTARLLSRLRATLAGDVLFVFQPAEEIASGAPAMLDDGVFAEPIPDAVFGLHLWNDLDAGLVGVRDGPLFANTDEIGILIRGSGGHGAMPHQTVDPIVVGAQVVSALQTMVSRETSPLEPAVVSITSFQGGSSWNIVPGEVQLRGTVRTFTNELQAQMRERIDTLLRGITLGMRAEYELTYRQACPAVVNDARIATSDTRSPGASLASARLWCHGRPWVATTCHTLQSARCLLSGRYAQHGAWV